MGQDICIRKDEKPLGYDWECGHEELYVRVNMYYNGSLYVGLWQKQKGDLLLLLKEQPDNSQILEIGVICVDGQKYPEETWLDVAGEQVEL